MDFKENFTGQNEQIIVDIELQARVYEAPGMCVAFVANNASGRPITVKFRDSELYLPSKSISILPDCKTVVFNSQSVSPSSIC